MRIYVLSEHYYTILYAIFHFIIFTNNHVFFINHQLINIYCFVIEHQVNNYNIDYDYD